MIEKKSLDLEKTILVGIISPKQTKEILDEYLDELSFLTYTAGGNGLIKHTSGFLKLKTGKITL